MQFKIALWSDRKKFCLPENWDSKGKKKKALNVYAFIECLPNLKNNSRNSMEVKET